ncbi:MAG: VOC family protein [Betaproteobacteria bacterium]|nr:VOC family protein [Betaproteobacteria bacterium]
MNLRIRDIDHIVLRVSDLERMIAFYRDVLGCAVEWRRPDLGLVHLRAGNALIDLVPVDGELGKKGGAAPGKEGRNMDHVCLRVEPFNVEDILAHLESHHVRTGEVRPRFGAQGESPSLYVYDPEGNMVELKGDQVPPLA